MTQPFNGSLTPGNYAAASSIISLLGKTATSNIDNIVAFAAEWPVPGNLYTPALLASIPGCIGCVGGAILPGPPTPSVVQNPNIGSWLVRPVEPNVVVGGRTFAVNAFADAVSLPAVNYLVWTGVGNNQPTTDAGIASAALTDNPAASSLAAGTVTSCDPFSVPAANCGSVVFQFTDNLIVNGLGLDFTVFDVNVPNLVSITIGGVTLEVGAINAGSVACPPNAPGCLQGAWGLNAADFDLSAFGIAPGGVVSSLSLNWGVVSNNTRAGVSLVGALNSQTVPEPSALALLVMAFAGLGFARRRKVN
jgi:hypothetical protein